MLHRLPGELESHVRGQAPAIGIRGWRATYDPPTALKGRCHHLGTQLSSGTVKFGATKDQKQLI